MKKIVKLKKILLNKIPVSVLAIGGAFETLSSSLDKSYYY
jgi:hypothetical protein